MATQLQIRRGTSSQVAAFTGAEGEVVVNTTNDSIHVNDGSTAGGFELARADLNNVSDTSLNAALTGNTVSALTVTALTTGSITTTGDISFGDNDKAIFGAGSDLQIYHDGSKSYITDAGAGNLEITGTDIRLLDNTSGLRYLVASNNSSNPNVSLFYSNGKVLETTSTGIDVTGTVTADGLTVDGASAGTFTAATFTNTTSANGTRVQAVLQNVSGACNVNLVSERVGANFGADFIVETSDTVDGTDRQRLRVAETGDISFYEDTGTTPKLFWDASAESLGINDTAPARRLSVNSAGTQIAAKFESTSTTSARIGLVDANTTADNYVNVAAVGNDMALYAGAAERVRIDASGNLLVGTTNVNPAANNVTGHALKAGGLAEHANSGAVVMRLNRTDSDGDILQFYKGTSTVGSIGSYVGTHLRIGNGTANVLFVNNTGILPATSSGTESDGILNLGASDRRFNDLHLNNVMYSGSARIATTTANSGGKIQVKTFSGGIFQVFQNSSGSTIGYIGNVSNSQTLYAQTSDERLKENITDSADAGSRIDAIQVRQFDWKGDGIHQDYGMVAQELQTVAPEVVFEPEDTNDMMGVDYSKLVPMLVKEIQSLRARVAQLEK